jgi:hypothetical protein
MHNTTIALAVASSGIAATLLTGGSFQCSKLSYTNDNQQTQALFRRLHCALAVQAASEARQRLWLEDFGTVDACQAHQARQTDRLG